MVKHSVSLIVVLVGALALSACAGNLSQQVQKLNHDMVKQSEQMHNAPAPKPSLSDAQFRAVSVDLNAIAVANLAWTKSVASGGDPITATITFFSVFNKSVASLAADAPAVALTNLKADIGAIQSKLAAAIGQ